MQDKDSPSYEVPLQVIIDGNPPLTAVADMTRADLQKQLGGTDHGFSIDLPTDVQDGVHTVELDVFDEQAGEYVLYKKWKVTTKDVAPTGKIVATSGGTISGWAFDQNAGKDAIRVEYLVDGSNSQTVTADVDMPSLQKQLGSTQHGFSISVPTDLAVGKHVISVFADDAATNAANKPATLLGKVTVTNHAPAVKLEVANGGTIAGWAYDLDVPGAALMGRVDVDGQEGEPFTADISRADVASRTGRWGGGSWVQPGLAGGFGGGEACG